MHHQRNTETEADMTELYNVVCTLQYMLNSYLLTQCTYSYIHVIILQKFLHDYFLLSVRCVNYTTTNNPDTGHACKSVIQMLTLKRKKLFEVQFSIWWNPLAVFR